MESNLVAQIAMLVQGYHDRGGPRSRDASAWYWREIDCLKMEHGDDAIEDARDAYDAGHYAAHDAAETVRENERRR